MLSRIGKAKLKKAEPESEFIAPHPIEECLNRLYNLEQPSNDFSRWTHAQVVISSDYTEENKYTVDLKFNRRYSFDIEIEGLLTPLSGNARTLVLLRSKARKKGWNFWGFLTVFTIVLWLATVFVHQANMPSGLPLICSLWLIAIFCFKQAINFDIRNWWDDSYKPIDLAEVRRILIL